MDPDTSIPHSNPKSKPDVKPSCFGRKVWIGSGDSPHIPEALIFEILGLIPARSLLRFRCVCKSWLELIDSREFIREHTAKALLQQQTSKTTRIYIHPVDGKMENNNPDIPFQEQEQQPLMNEFSVVFPPFDESSAAAHRVHRKLYTLEYENGKAKLELFRGITSPCTLIAASNGLILLNLAENNNNNVNKEGGSRLVVVNPLTGKYTRVPPGTNPPKKVNCRCGCLKHESFAFSHMPSTGDYKLVHLFLDDLGYVRCEFLVLSTRLWKPLPKWPKWRMNHNHQLLDNALNLYGAFEALGAVHWVDLIGHDTLVSVGIEDNKVYKIQLPKNGKAAAEPLSSSCRLNFEMDGYLCSGLYCYKTWSFDLWLFKELSRTSRWIKHSTIKDFSINIMLYARDTKEIVSADYIRHVYVGVGRRVERNLVAYGSNQRRRKLEIVGDPQLLEEYDEVLPYIHSLRHLEA